MRYYDIYDYHEDDRQDWFRLGSDAVYYFNTCTVRILLFCTMTNKCTITRVGTLIVATIYLKLIQNRYMFRSFTVLQCSHQHCVQPVASNVKIVGYL